MDAKQIKNEFENKNLKYQNKQLLNTNTLLKKQLNDLNNKFEEKLEKRKNEAIKLVEKENKFLKRQLDIKIDLEQRLTKKLETKDETIREKNETIREKDSEIEALKRKIIEQAKEIEKVTGQRDEYLAKLNVDGTNSSLPTSMTPINKKKIIPNTRVKTGKSIGGQYGHKKNKLESFSDEEINEVEEVKLEECPYCSSKELIELDTSVEKDELDYEIKIIKKRYYFKEYECKNCHKKIRKNIPNKLKEDNQYGNKVQAHVLSLTNIGNVPINKTRRIIKGLTSNEIDLSEGYITKLQKRASDLSEKFIKDLKEYIYTLDIIHWDDTVIFVNSKRACLRGYCNENIILYTAHEQKNKTGLDEDDILSKLEPTVRVVHDHNKVNYNEDYKYVNVECCVHLERDLEKVKTNIPESTWSSKLKELFMNYNKKRNEYLNKKIESFSFEETNEFMIKFDEYILLGVEENKKHGKSHYYTDEKALLARLMKYRDNYTYWLYDFSIPYTNNEAERGLRTVKTKMKVSGQFKNIQYAKYYANIKTYIETCHKNGLNETEALTKLLDGNPYTIEEIKQIIKEKEEAKNNE